MIRTAIPFGYLLVALFLCAAFIGGLAVFAVGWRRRSRFARWIGAALCALIVLVVVAENAFDSALEWNPSIDADTRIVGTWTDHKQTVILASDHTFTYQTAAQTARGKWTRDDWNLYLTGDSLRIQSRFVQFRGQYRLMIHPPDEPDLWDGNLGLWLAPH